MAQALMLVLATTFVLAAVTKLRDRASFQQVLVALAGRAAPRSLAFAVPVAELALAAALLVGIQPRAVALLTLAVLTAFSWALVRLRAQPQLPSCNCFGSGTRGPDGGLARNAALGALALALVVAPSGGAVWSQPLAELAAAASVAVGGACAWQLAAALVPVWRAAGR